MRETSSLTHYLCFQFSLMMELGALLNFSP
jgi:hypothetical protein